MKLTDQFSSDYKELYKSYFILLNSLLHTLLKEKCMCLQGK